MKKYDIFLFDADGTLYDYDMAEANALEKMFSNYGLDYSDKIRQKYREINTQEWKKFENNETTKEDLQTSRFIRLFDYIGVSCNAKDFNEKYLCELGKGAFLIDGALEICEYIISQNKKIYIVTNGILATQTSRIKHSRINEYISDFFVSEHVGFQKPHTSYFNYVFSHIPQAEKHSILIIGDSLTADIQGGHNAGIDSCWLNAAGEKNKTSITPTYEVRGLLEVKKYV